MQKRILWRKGKRTLELSSERANNAKMRINVLLTGRRYVDGPMVLIRQGPLGATCGRSPPKSPNLGHQMSWGGGRSKRI